jgi:hypothetical protein
VGRFLGPEFVLSAFVELAMVAKSVAFSGHHYIPEIVTGGKEQQQRLYIALGPEN